MARGWPTRKAVTPPATSDADLESSALPAAADTHETRPEQSHADLLTDDATDLPEDREIAAPNPTGPGVLRRRLERVPGVLAPRLARLVIAPGAGWLMYASFPTLNWWWAAVVAIALLSWVLVHPATTPVGGLGYGFLFGLAFYGPLLPWISTLVGTMPWLVLAAVCACFPALFGLVAVVVRRLPGWPIWFAVLWGAQEWLKSSVPFGGFPWGLIAFGQASGPLLPLVQLGGVALLSSAVVLLGSSLTAFALEIVRWFRAGGASGSVQKGDEAAKPPAVVLPGVNICLVLLAAILVWPQVRHAGVGSGGEPTVTVAVVQGNVPRLGLDFNAQRRVVLDNHVAQTLRLAEDVQAGLAPQPRFVIWPEDSSDIDPFVNADAGQQIAKAAAAIDAPILIGTVLGVPGRLQENPEYTNTMIVWDPGRGPADRHDKAIVQPFGEYLPMPWLFRHLSGYADRAGHFVPVPGDGVVRITGVPVGVATCWEVVFDRAPRNSVLNGAQVLTVPSNNATFTKTMSEQQLAIAKVRAVEHDRFVLVAGTTGVSAVIAPDGGELKRTDFFVPDYLDTQVRLKTNLTPATRWAPILQWVLVGAAGALILAAIRHNGWFPRPARRRSGPPDGDSDTPSGEADAPSEAMDDLDVDDATAGQLKTANNAPSDPQRKDGGETQIGRDEGAT
jgi:apolipoprotein N-acyltransferase